MKSGSAHCDLELADEVRQFPEEKEEKEKEKEEKDVHPRSAVIKSSDPHLAAVGNVREYVEKVKFLDAICPDKDRPMLAPRLAMLCKGTAWGQVRALDPTKLTDKVNGVKNLLAALSSWEESAEMKTYELFEKAIYKTNQKADESAMSFVNRLQVAMDELGQVTVKQFHAFLLLRQSSLSAEDKKRVLTMTSGEMETAKVEQAMRTLATTVLSSEPKKKVYPTNFVETENETVNQDDESQVQYAHYVNADEDDALTVENLEYMAQSGDEDALMIQSFEKDFSDMLQDIPELQTALLSYQEARQRISDRRRHRGFWPSRGKGKGFGKGSRKGGPRSSKDELLARIARTHCKICGAVGHWKAECPRRNDLQKEQANIVLEEGDDNRDFLQVHFEVSDDEQDSQHESCFVVHSDFDSKHPSSVLIPSSVRLRAIAFLSQRLTNILPKMGHPTMQHSLSFCQTEDQVNQVSCSAAANNGLAILDTGASRSVIGSEHVTAVLQKLPESVRNQVREKPSHVGFRFGNNQTAYSFKQFQIPLRQGKMRIWLLVEVVPKATPFLLSIKAMKSLGAKIDLVNESCYLETLQRSLPLKTNSTGLYVIDVADLCHVPSSHVEAAHTVSSAHCIPAPPGLSLVTCADHAIASRGVGGFPPAGGGDPRESSGSLHHVVHHDEGSGSRRDCVGWGDGADPPIGERGQESTHEDHRAQPSDHASTDAPSSSEPLQPGWTTVRRVGGRGDGSHGTEAQMIAASMGPSQAAPAHTSSAPIALGPKATPQTCGGKKNMKIAGINIPGLPSQAAGSNMIESNAAVNNQQLALTQATLDSWGNKVITWGKKHKGATYVTTYEGDCGYVQWILARTGSLSSDLEDFANYAITRRRLEEVARQQALK
eukprot:s308_g54.t1